MATYLVSRPGRPLHLAVWACDRQEYQSGRWLSGRNVPLCGQDRGAEWHYTGPWAEKWPQTRRGGLCARCQSELAKLVEAVTPDE